MISEWLACHRRGRVVSAASAAVLMLGCASDVPPRQVDGTGAKGLRFVSNEQCAECHEEEFTAWRGSHHDLAMQPAAEETVLGDFEDATFDYYGFTSTFFRRNESFVVRTEGPGGAPDEYEVLYTFGVEPLQQYLVAFPGGRLQCLPLAWDTGRKRWFHLYPNERITHDDPLHWTGHYQNWNLMCAECHSTNLRKNYDMVSDSYRTEWDEINVSCQACHGPGEAHVEWARLLPEGATPRPGEHKLVVDYTQGDSRYQVDTCARCHSRRHQVSPDNLHGRPFMDDFQVATLREGLYHADGQILDEVYVYGSFVQSKMYERGVRCTDCHNAHTLQLKGEGNTTCVECHQLRPPERFPTLKPRNYDSPDHHFHPAGSESARCVNCHMSERVYMVVDPRRDHSFRIPRPDLSVRLGTPNACNDCHEGETAEWAADAVAKWYPQSVRAPHYAAAIIGGRQEKPGAESELIQLAEDWKQPAIARATALELLEGMGSGALRAMEGLARDEDALVRTKAVAGLDWLPPLEQAAALAAALSDPIRSVRIEAARILAGAPREMLRPEEQEAFDAALNEFRETQIANADTPGANLNLGIMHSGMGDLEAAEKCYRRAIRQDKSFLPAQVNLVTLLNQTGRNEEAETILRAAIAQAPDNGELRYSLGLLLAEENRLTEAAHSLGEAVELMPSRARVRYNFALALQHLGRAPEAESELLRAHNDAPEDAAIVNALVILYIQQQRLREARVYAMKLVELAPGQPGPRQMLTQIEEQLVRTQ